MIVNNYSRISWSYVLQEKNKLVYKHSEIRTAKNFLLVLSNCESMVMR